MLIDLTSHFVETRRRRTWGKARVVGTIDPSGTRFRADELGRLMCYEDYGEPKPMGWTLVSIDQVDYPFNQRSLAEFMPPHLNGFSPKLEKRH